jgi:hypothetical protein
MVEAGVEIEIGSGKSNLVDFDLRFKTKLEKAVSASALRDLYCDRNSNAPRPNPKPAPRPAAQPKQWHRGKYQDALMAALERHKLTPFEVVVGFALSKFADKAGDCFPSIEKIARKVGAKVRLLMR